MTDNQKELLKQVEDLGAHIRLLREQRDDARHSIKILKATIRGLLGHD